MYDSTPAIKTWTYHDLISYHTKLSTNEQILRNQRTALNHFLGHLGLSVDSAVGPELTINFIGEVSSLIAKQGIDGKQARDRKSLLSAWQKSFVAMVKTDGLPDDFSQALVLLVKMSGKSHSQIARDAGYDQSNLSQWITKGRIPRPHMRPVVIRVEKALGVPPNTLLCRLPITSSTGRSKHETKATPWGQKSAERMKQTYAVSELPPRVKAAWDALFHFKTTDFLQPGIERTKRGQWRVRPDGACESAGVYHGMLKSFFGFLTLPVTAESRMLEGKGLAYEDLEFAMICEPDYLFPYVEFMRIRANGEYNQYTQTIFQFALSVAHPKQGFLTQHPVYYVLPGIEKFSPEAVKARCESNHAHMSKVLSSLKGKIKATRRPDANIKAILDMQRPLDALIQMNLAADLDFVRRWGGREDVSEAVATMARNKLISKLITSNPLRSRNIRHLTYRSDGNGQLRKRPDGSWWIEIEAHHFKNEKGAAKDKPYIVMVNKSLWPEIEEYLTRYRPHLFEADRTDIFFLKGGQAKSTTKRGAERHALSKPLLREILVQFSATYCPVETYGVNPHSYRHIIATDYLKNNPNGIQVAAAILHDKPETVMKAYAHLIVYDCFRPWDDYFNDASARVRRGLKEK